MILPGSAYAPAAAAGDDPRFAKQNQILMGTHQATINGFGETADPMTLENPQWARWFNAIKGLNGGKGARINSGLDSLDDDPAQGQVPLMMQGIPGADYAGDNAGQPTMMRTRRK